MSNEDTRPAVLVQDISKSFRIPLEGNSGLKQQLINQLKGRRGYREFTPLKGISFSIKKGEFFGIVGRNGSGKSTLLKMIAGIYPPNGGDIVVNGKLVPFIELGVGFNPELTGRENIFLNGALLGFDRKEMIAMYEEIVSFSELHDFMEERLKNYSSGMQVRLAFSIAIRAKGDILLLDEVLAVGDEAFQRKCFNYFEQLKRQKKTVVLVTHDMGSVERFCNRALFLNEGKIELIGSPHKVAAAYSRSNDEAYNVDETDEDDTAASTKSNIAIKLYNSDGKETNKFICGDNMTVRMAWKKDGVKHAGIAIFRQSGEYIFGPNTYLDGHKLRASNKLTYTINLNLGEGMYFLKAGIFGKNDNIRIDFEENGPEFIVSRDKDDLRWGGFTKLEHTWE